MTQIIYACYTNPSRTAYPRALGNAGRNSPAFCFGGGGGGYNIRICLYLKEGEAWDQCRIVFQKVEKKEKRSLVRHTEGKNSTSVIRARMR